MFLDIPEAEEHRQGMEGEVDVVEGSLQEVLRGLEVHLLREQGLEDGTASVPFSHGEVPTFMSFFSL